MKKSISEKAKAVNNVATSDNDSSTYTVDDPDITDTKKKSDSKNVTAGSLAAKANLVQQYNDRNK